MLNYSNRDFMHTPSNVSKHPELQIGKTAMENLRKKVAARKAAKAKANKYQGHGATLHGSTNVSGTSAAWDSTHLR